MIALMLLACGGSTPAEKPPEPQAAAQPAAVSDVERALAVAKAIDANPSKADEALAAQGLTEADYRALLVTIAKDPVKSKVFATKR